MLCKLVRGACCLHPFKSPNTHRVYVARSRPVCISFQNGCTLLRSIRFYLAERYRRGHSHHQRQQDTTATATTVAVLFGTHYWLSAECNGLACEEGTVADGRGLSFLRSSPRGVRSSISIVSTPFVRYYESIISFDGHVRYVHRYHLVSRTCLRTTCIMQRGSLCRMVSSPFKSLERQSMNT